ncbi:phosphonate ABC transporter, permease protein PhnE [uncultured Clostridium sp.]|uniref:phosphonate ABC transporter, permease protein PhnE n=1 Tax=Clostridium sp. TaxID=1506 RepID=UPI0025F3BD31|nr:phosphonate ABC transporter, permease protein PhnE [uncultured Clostridium sp.]MEE0933612.1 phosphonate ABC transporter, permease protein PhnE [Clostridium sp.]
MEISVKKQLEKQPNTWISKALTVLFVVLVIVWASKGINFGGIKSNGVDIAKNVLSGIIHPDVEMLLTEVPALLLETICIALIGTLIGAILAVPLAFISSTNIMPKWVSAIGLFIIAALRTFPAFVYGLMFIRVTGPGAFAGVLTVSVISIGMIAKLFIESIEDLDTRILESLDAAGCNTFEKIRYGILPQLFTDFVSTVIYRFEINIKDASVLGLVGAGGIGAPLIFAMNAFNWDEVGAILCGLIVLVLVVEIVSTKIRTKLARG